MSYSGSSDVVQYIENFDCAECGAAPGARCFTVRKRSSGAARYPHHYRIAAALLAAGGAKVRPVAHDLTPSEVAVARVLGAWEGWGHIHGKDRARHAMSAVWEVLVNSGYVLGLTLTDDGAALLDRARKAGVL